MTPEPAITRPILRYFGGKFRVGPWIITHFPGHDIYVEPYGGGGSVLLLKPRVGVEIYNDLDGEVVNLFRVVRDRSAELARAVELTPFAREEFEGSYEPTDDPVERARRMLARSYMGHGSDGAVGKWKTGFRGVRYDSSVPAKEWAQFPPALRAISDRLAGVTIENMDAKALMVKYDTARTLHYVDPPYVHELRTRGPQRGYRHEMTDQDHRELAALLGTLKGMVLVSGYHGTLYDELFAGWERVEHQTLADGARPRTEVLWMRNVDHGLFATT